MFAATVLYTFTNRRPTRFRQCYIDLKCKFKNNNHITRQHCDCDLYDHLIGPAQLMDNKMQSISEILLCP